MSKTASDSTAEPGRGSSVIALVALASAGLIAGALLLFGAEDAPPVTGPLDGSASNGPPQIDPFGPPTQIVDRYDTDGDRRVSRKEFDLFDRLDLNLDGFVDEEEVSAAARGGQGGGQLRGDERGGSRGGAGGPGGASRSGGSLQRRDLDGDGVLSPTEFPGPEVAFEAIDTDSSGFLDPDELKARDMSRAGQNPWEGRWPRGATETAEDGVMEWSSDDDAAAPPWP